MVAKTNERHHPATMFDEMPVEDLLYKRKGGCFITYHKWAVIAAILVLTHIVIIKYILKFTQDRDEYPNALSFEDFLREQQGASKLTARSSALNSIIPKRYKLFIQPIFNETADDQAFTFYATVWITFTPSVVSLNRIELNAAPSLSILENNVFVYRNRALSKASFEADHVPLATRFRLKDFEYENQDYITSTISSTTDDSTALYSPEEMSTSSENITVASDEVETLLPANDSQSVPDKQQIMPREFDEVVVTAVKRDDRSGKLSISVGTEMRKNRFYVLKIGYSGKMRQDDGLIWSQFDDTHVLGATLTQDRFGSAVFPCVDDFAGKSTFELLFRRRSNMRTLSVAKLIRSEMESPTHSVDIYDRSQPIHLREFGFAVIDLPWIELRLPHSTVDVHLRTVLKQTSAAMVTEHMPKLIQNFERSFGVSAIDRIHIVAVPNRNESFVDRKHNLIFISENIFIAEDESEQRLKAMEPVLQIQAVWLDAIFETKRLDQQWLREAIKLGSNIIQEDVLEKRFSAMRTNMAHGDISLKTIGSVDPPYMDIAQSKGICLLELIKRMLTKPIYDVGLQNYAERRLRGQDDNLFEIFESSLANNKSIVDFKELIKSWTTFPGYPILLITNKSNIDQVTVEGTHTNYKWIVPIELVQSNQTWIMAKAEYFAFYRINYAEENWMKLLNAIDQQDELLGIQERAIIADDALNLARLGLLSFSIINRMLSIWSRREIDYLPWLALLDNLEPLYYHSIGLPGFDRFQIHLRESLLTSYNRIVLSSSDAVVPSKLKLLLNHWACVKLNLRECVELVKSDFLRLIGNGRLDKSRTNNPGLYTILCTAIRNGGWNEWQMVRDSFEIEDHEYNQVLTRSLGCTRDASTLATFVQFLSHIMYENYRADVFIAAAANVLAKPFVMEYVFANFDTLLEEGTGLDGLEIFLRTISSSFEWDMLVNIYEKWSKQIIEAKSRLNWPDIVRHIRATIQWKLSIGMDMLEVIN